MNPRHAIDWRFVATLGLVLAAGWLLAIRAWVPPRARGADAAEQVFSAARAADVLAELMPDEQPRPSGSAENARVRERIAAHLESLGYEVHRQSAFVCGPFRHYCGQVTNVLARKKGSGAAGAVLLNAHYDTMPATPGASDCMAGVAALLETARALDAGPALEADVIFLFNDGEEAGLLGSTAFVEEHPWAADVSVALNLEARGSAGPSAPAYTVGDDRRLLASYVGTARWPAPGSAYLAITRHLPLTNDLTIFERLGVPGVMFGYARHARHYHTPRDTLDVLSLRSLQQHGENALRVTRSLGASLDPPAGDTAEGIGERAMFFSIGPWGLALSTRWALPLAIVALVLLAGCGVRWVRAGRLSVVDVAIGLAFWPGAVIVAFFGAATLNFLRRQLTETVSANVASPMPTFVGFVLVGTAIVIAAALPLRRRLGAPGGWLGTWVAWAVLAIVVAALEPLAAYLFTVPALVAGALGLSAFEDAASRRWVTRAALVLPALAVVAIWYPHLMLLVDLIGIGNLPPMAALAAVAATGCVPLVRKGAGRAALAILVLGIASVGVGTRLPTFTQAHPQYANLLYHLDAESGTGRWAFTGYPVPPSLDEAVTFESDWQRLDPWAPQDAGFVATAPGIELSPPALEVANNEPLDDGFRVVGRLVSQRGAPVVQMIFASDAAPKRVRIEGVVVPEDAARYAIFDADHRVFTVWTVPPAGVRVELEFPSREEVTVELRDRSYDLPAAAAPLVDARGERAVPSGLGDGTLVRAATRLAPPDSSPGGHVARRQ